MKKKDQDNIFIDKNILLISQQEWGKMYISKHNYAIELAKRGNTVFFLNPPKYNLNRKVEIIKHEKIKNLHIVSYKPLFPFIIRFHFRWLFDWLMALQIFYLLKKIRVKIDIVWCFNPYHYSDLRKFKANLKIFHPVDQFDNLNINISRYSNVVFSVTSDILEKFKATKTPHFIINHGLADPFAKYSQINLKKNSYYPHKPLRFGYIGNLLSPAFDRKIIKKIIRVNSDVQFSFWGPFQMDQSNVNNVGDISKDSYREALDFLKSLEKEENVIFRGVQPIEILAKEIQSMDGFLLCYDLEVELNKGANTHKILEYLSTGKVVIANHVSTYSKHRELIEMMNDNNNELMPELFRKVVDNIELYNSEELRKKRIELALDNTYSKQIDRIENIINQLS